MDDLLPAGAEPGTMPTDLEQATGLERLEILGKMQGIDIFDMRPLQSDRTGTFAPSSSPPSPFLFPSPSSPSLPRLSQFSSPSMY